MKRGLILAAITLLIACFSACFIACKECEHSGGTATCTQLAVCEKCGKPYGEK